MALNEKLESATRKRDGVEAYLRTLAKKLFLMVEGTPFNLTALLLAS